MLGAGFDLEGRLWDLRRDAEVTAGEFLQVLRWIVRRSKIG